MAAKTMKGNNDHEINSSGQFVPQANQFNASFGDKAGELPVAAGKYRLIWTEACPFANRLIIIRKLLGLEDVISVGTTSPIRPQIGRVDWAFSDDADQVDPVLGIAYLGDAYLTADPTYSGRPTVPALIDIETKAVVQNDYDNLPYYFAIQWQKYHKADAPDLLPADQAGAIMAFNQMLSDDINNGVYKAGFAKNQAAYEVAYDTVFKRFDEFEERLARQRYLFGKHITDSDIRLFTTLVRFDMVYYNKFNLNRNLLIDFPNLWHYAKDLYQTPGFGETINFEAIRLGYHYHFRGDATKGPAILPKGPTSSQWHEAHNRNRFS